MSPDQQNTAPRIVDYWRAIEALSPAAPPQNDRKGHVWTVGEAVGMPWHERMRATYRETPRHRWRFLVYVGLFDMEGVVGELRDLLKVGDDEERPRAREAALACLCATADGHVFGEAAVSAVPWAMNEIASARGELRFGDPNDVEKRIVTRISDHLAERAILLDANGAPPKPSCPLELADCEAIAAIIAKESGWAPHAGLKALVRVKGVRLTRRKEGSFGEIEPDLLNSFFLKDLGRVSAALAAGEHGAGLPLYLFGHAGPHTDVAREPAAVERLLHPRMMPPGCWPASGGHPLVLAQQFAVNAALDRLKNGAGLFSVNGPPGTGKTTLLRDLIVGVIIERARVLAGFANPEQAFVDRQRVKNSNYPVWRLDDRLLGFEMVVASSNNGAVENVTREVPGIGAIDPRWLDEADHFRAVADVVQAPDDEPLRTGQCWGLLGAVLGNKENRSTFARKFWLGHHDKTLDPPPPTFRTALTDGTAPSWPEARAAFREALERFEARRAALVALAEALSRRDTAHVAFTEAEAAVVKGDQVARAAAERADAARARAAVASERAAQTRRCAEAAERVETLAQTVAEAKTRLADATGSIRQDEVALTELETTVAELHARIVVEQDADGRLDAQRPWWLARLLNTPAHRDWQRRKMQAYDAIIELSREHIAAESRRSRARSALDSARTTLATLPTILEQARVDFAEARHTFAAFEASADPSRTPAVLRRAAILAEGEARTAAAAAQNEGMARQEAERALTTAEMRREAAHTALAVAHAEVAPLVAGFAGTVVDAAWRAGTEAEQQKSAPWMDADLHQLRVTCFLRALDLHRAFLAGAAQRVRMNLSTFVDVLMGKVRADAVEGGPRSLWATFCMAVPLVSTTFASFDRLFDAMGSESLGWLFVDEAGQATPQAALGAVWRARRAVIIGDPLQLEPVVTLPAQAIEAIRRRCAVADRWHPIRASAQVLADRANPLGTAIDQGGAEPLWVGSPLRVHRRCIDPMFSVANGIAYDGLMVLGRKPAPAFATTLGDSRWIDVPAEGAEGHFIPAQAEVAGRLVLGAQRDGNDCSIYVISPFRKVAYNMRTLLEQDGLDPQWIKQSVGTVHTFQGKEADLVILLLGGDPARPGAMDWAAEKPNLLNVALTRAKNRVYVVGDRRHWMRRRYFDVLADALPVAAAAPGGALLHL
ncbi:AAA domain-containing protein [Azospirillum argentinense]